jgi:hypothetical protein
MQQVRYRRTKETDKVIVLEARDVCAHLIFISYIVNVSLHSVYTVIMCIANAVIVLYIALFKTVSALAPLLSSLRST